MASGSHVCNPSCADFPIAPINNKIEATSKAGISISKNEIEIFVSSDAFAKI